MATEGASKECGAPRCTSRVSHPGFTLCYPHSRAEKAAGKKVAAATSAGADATAETRATLSATKIALHFGLSSQRMNLVLAELQWLEKYVKG